jgi:acyl carrier protein
VAWKLQQYEVVALLVLTFLPSTGSNRLRATSLDMVETMKSLEDEFDIEISDRDAETFKAVDDAIALVQNKF